MPFITGSLLALIFARQSFLQLFPDSAARRISKVSRTASRFIDGYIVAEMAGDSGSVL